MLNTASARTLDTYTGTSYTPSIRRSSCTVSWDSTFSDSGNTYQSMSAGRPFSCVTVTGITMDIGISLLVVNLMKTSRLRRAA